MSYSPYLAEYAIKYNPSANRVEVNGAATSTDFVVFNNSGEVVFQAGGGVPEYLSYPHAFFKFDPAVNLAAQVMSDPSAEVEVDRANVISYKEFALPAEGVPSNTLTVQTPGLYKIEMNMTFFPQSQGQEWPGVIPYTLIHCTCGTATANNKFSAAGSPIITNTTVLSGTPDQVMPDGTITVLNEYVVHLMGVAQLAENDTVSFFARTSQDVSYGEGALSSSYVGLIAIS